MNDEKITARFMSKVDKDGPTVAHVDGLEPCWMWTASRRNGYGQMKVDGRVISAHRISYEIHNGPVLAGMFICHRCDVKLCVNPAHMFLGTHADNMRDMTIKGRSVHHPAPPGEGHPCAKLSDDKVVEIRTLYAMGGFSQKELAKRFGVTKANISYITLRKTWRHVA